MIPATKQELEKVILSQAEKIAALEEANNFTLQSHRDLEEKNKKWEDHHMEWNFADDLANKKITDQHQQIKELLCECDKLTDNLAGAIFSAETLSGRAEAQEQQIKELTKAQLDNFFDTSTLEKLTSHKATLAAVEEAFQYAWDAGYFANAPDSEVTQGVKAALILIKDCTSNEQLDKIEKQRGTLAAVEALLKQYSSMGPEWVCSKALTLIAEQKEK